MKKFEDLIGHTEYLRKIASPNFEKARNLSLSASSLKDPTPKDEINHHAISQIHEIDKALDKRFEESINKAKKSNKSSISIETEIININRSFGTYTSGLVAEHKAKLADDFITFKLKGTAGQSLGAFLRAVIP